MHDLKLKSCTSCTSSALKLSEDDFEESLRVEGCVGHLVCAIVQGLTCALPVGAVITRLVLLLLKALWASNVMLLTDCIVADRSKSLASVSLPTPLVL